jgi:hypothetical protein
MALTVESRLEISPDLEKLLDSHRKIAPDAIKAGIHYVTLETPDKVKQRITQLGLVRHGKLAKSVVGTEVLQKSIIGSAHPVAHILEGGAKPHEIVPKCRKNPEKYKTKALHWGSSGPLSKVKHPGVKAYRYLEGTIKNMESSGELESLFSRGVREAIQKLGG